MKKLQGLIWRALGLSVVTLALSVSVNLLTPVKAEAATGSCNTRADLAYNRAEWCGYFLNNEDANGSRVFDNGIPSSVNTAAEFINLINNYRLNGDTQHKIGAKFIILTMLGAPGGTASSQADVRYNEWVALINGYAALGKIDWNYAHPFYCNILNSYYQENFPDDAFYTEPASAGRCGPTVTRQSIIFRHPTTNAILYAIKRDCANPIGEIKPLQKIPYDLTGSLTPGVNTPSFGGIVEPGRTYQLVASVYNPAIVPADPFTMQSGNLNSAYVQNAGVAAPGTYTGSCAPSAPCWRWDYSTLNGRATSTRTFNFSISPTVPEGTVVCFNLTVDPARSDGTRETVGPYCFTAYRPHYPGIIGANGDVHAGGGICDGMLTNGTITTRSQSNSLTEYVLSASGIVSNFGSNNTAGGTRATLGRTGNYSRVCRPDLVKVARDYYNAGGGYTPLGNSAYNLGSMPASATGIYIHNTGGNLSLSGTYTGSRPITIVALSGVVNITNPVVLNAPSLEGKDAPSIGIISANDININGAATRVDAYLFADGTINTCVEGNTAACRNTLDVNGFLMSRAILFRRLGPATGGTATVGERINLTGQLYMNPPKFFDSAASRNNLQNQGERPPLN